MGFTGTVAVGPCHQRGGESDSLALPRTYPGDLSRTTGLVLSRASIHRGRGPRFGIERRCGETTTVTRAKTVAGTISRLCRWRAETNDARQDLHDWRHGD